jgi:hypothetical protein
MTRQGAVSAPAAPVPYPDTAAHLADELDRLDVLLRLRVTALRRSWQERPEPEGPPGYISDAQVDWLLDPARQSSLDMSTDDALRVVAAASRERIDGRLGRTAEDGVFMPLARLAGLFGLSDFETDTIVICLAPELRRRYDVIYAYLQDDIARKRPSIDLALDVLCENEGERWNARAVLAAGAPLFHAGILESVDDPESPSGSSGLAQFLRLDPRILQFLLGHTTIDPRLAGLVHLSESTEAADEVPVDPEARRTLLGFATRWAADNTAPRERVLLHLRGQRGVGKRRLALAICGVMGRPMLSLDAARLPADPGQAELLLRFAFRESLLHQAPLYVSPASAFLRDGEESAALRGLFAQAVESFGWFMFLGGDGAWPQRELFSQIVFHETLIPSPGRIVREGAWTQALVELLPGDDPGDLALQLADRFRLTPEQIKGAVAAVAGEASVHDSDWPVSFDTLAAASRAQTQHELGALAAKVDPGHTWDDLVLPDAGLDQLVELCGHIKHDGLVFDRWGFARKVPYGRGVSALFFGPPGTGKTMAAEVIAAELRLDLYKVDLARVVSKYIGETEKSLARIFAEAENSNAILFFDEADALFAKRTEISDAHDRYANLETSYLLQRMEDYAGVVILATNLRENMDQAFIRRIRFVIEFPFPDAASRERIWRAHMPLEAPISPSIDYAFLGDRIQVAGGNIKNIVLSAAFAAASDGGEIGMDHLLHGTRREFEKIGKLWDGAALIAGGRGERR